MPAVELYQWLQWQCGEPSVSAPERPVTVLVTPTDRSQA